MCVIQNNKLEVLGGAKPIIPINGIIKWHIDETKIPLTIGKYELILAFQKSFEILSKEFNPIKFESESDINKAPIVIRFRDNSDNIPEKFSNGVLAYAYGNYEGHRYASDIFFNISMPWWDMHKEGFYSLKKVCVHEALHSLGFSHSNIIGDILYWQYQLDDNIFFSEDTRQAIRQFYPEVKVNQLTDFINRSRILEYITFRDLIKLAESMGIIIDTKKSKSFNIGIIKKYLA